MPYVTMSAAKGPTPGEAQMLRGAQPDRHQLISWIWYQTPDATPAPAPARRRGDGAAAASRQLSHQPLAR